MIDIEYADCNRPIEFVRIRAKNGRPGSIKFDRQGIMFAFCGQGAGMRPIELSLKYDQAELVEFGEALIRMGRQRG